jgi:biopolymer transport protein ExbD
MSSNASIQITSLADVFIIVLLFLLKSFGSSEFKITPAGGIDIPSANNNNQEPNALKIDISNNACIIENKTIYNLTNFRFPEADILPNYQVTKLVKTFEEIHKRQKFIAEHNKTLNPSNEIIIIADKQTPYLTLQQVLASAAAHGFIDVKLIVSKKE